MSVASDGSYSTLSLSGSPSSASSAASAFASASAHGIPVFSHAPPSSSLSIRNSKKASFYQSYLSRGDWNADYLASTFEIARLAEGNKPIIIELETDRDNQECYEAYVNMAK